MSVARSSAETYLSRLRKLDDWTPGLDELMQVFTRPDTNSTKVLYISRDTEWPIKSPSDLAARGLQESSLETICVIENISPAYIEAIGSAWDLDPRFFTGHAWNPLRESIWSHRVDDLD